MEVEQEDIIFLLLIPSWFILFHEASWVGFFVFNAYQNIMAFLK